MGKKDKAVRLDPITIRRITSKAMLISVANNKGKLVEAWIPKSQIVETDCLAEGDEGYIVVAEWIAKENELVETND